MKSGHNTLVGDHVMIITAERHSEATVASSNGLTLHAIGMVLTGDPVAILSAYLDEQPNALLCR